MKALRLVQKSRARAHYTAKRAGETTGAVDKVLGTVVRNLEKVLSR